MCESESKMSLLGKRAGAFALAVVIACGLSFPQLALAAVRVDDTELAQGDNAVGGGTATLADSELGMVGVTAGELYTDENLSISFNGGNEIDSVNVAGSAEVDMSFAGENEVEEVHASDESDVTINADGHNEFEEIEATDQSNLTVNVTGENEFEEIVGRDDANVTIRGTNCQMQDVVNLGEGEDDTAISTERGKLTIDHVTVNLEGEEAYIGSESGDVVIDTSKIGKGDDNEYAYLTAGGKMLIRESVIDIAGTVHSAGQMTIEHSDVKAEEPDDEYGDDSPYRVYSETGIELIREKNGEVLEGEIDGDKVFFVDTDDNDGSSVDLKADGKPAYYGCGDDDDDDDDEAALQAKSMPKTGDGASPLIPLVMAIAGVAAAGFAMRRCCEQR